MHIQQTRTYLTSLESELHEDTLTQDALTASMSRLYKLIERLMDETFKTQDTYRKVASDGQIGKPMVSKMKLFKPHAEF